MLVLNNFRVYRGGTPVLDRICLQLPSPGLLFLVGAGGAGKSTLLRALAGNADEIRSGGTASLDGIPIGPKLVGNLIGQHDELSGDTPLGGELAERTGLARGMLGNWLRGCGLDEVSRLLDARCAELPRSLRRMLAVLTGLSIESQLMLVDEPCAGLEAPKAAIVWAWLRAISRRSILIVATHNRLECLALGGHTALVAGGTVQECATSERFFTAPSSDAARIYVDTGNCSLPTAHTVTVQEHGIWWVVPGLLCGMSRPGLVAEVETQYRALALRGVRRLVCLEERCEYSISAAREYGIAHLHVPVADMAPPTFGQAVDLCRAAEEPIRRNTGVALHCRGGLGRTGTAIALILIWFGDDASTAIDKVRRAKTQAIQSEAQLRFLYEFADRIRGWHPRNT